MPSTAAHGGFNPIHAVLQRDAVAAKAAELGIEPDVLIMRVVESAIVLDDLYEAVTDGRYT